MFFVYFKCISLLKIKVMEENAVKKVVGLSRLSQKEICDITGTKKSNLHRRMNNDIIGTIEMSLEIAKETGINKYSIVKNGYTISVKINK